MLYDLVLIHSHKSVSRQLNGSEGDELYLRFLSCNGKLYLI